MLFWFVSSRILYVYQVFKSHLHKNCERKLWTKKNCNKNCYVLAWCFPVELSELACIPEHCATSQTSCLVRAGMIRASFYIATHSLAFWGPILKSEIFQKALTTIGGLVNTSEENNFELFSSDVQRWILHRLYIFQSPFRYPRISLTLN